MKTQQDQESKLNLKKFQILNIKNLAEIIGGGDAETKTVDTKVIIVYPLKKL